MKKQSCLCILCKNAYTKIKAINTYRKISKLQPIHSVTSYLNAQESVNDIDKYPEKHDPKSINYYAFETPCSKTHKSAKKILPTIHGILLIFTHVLSRGAETNFRVSFHDQYV